MSVAERHGDIAQPALVPDAPIELPASSIVRPEMRLTEVRSVSRFPGGKKRIVELVTHAIMEKPYWKHAYEAVTKIGVGNDRANKK